MVLQAPKPCCQGPCSLPQQVGTHCPPPHLATRPASAAGCLRAPSSAELVDHAALVQPSLVRRCFTHAHTTQRRSLAASLCFTPPAPKGDAVANTSTSQSTTVHRPDHTAPETRDQGQRLRELRGQTREGQLGVRRGVHRGLSAPCPLWLRLCRVPDHHSQTPCGSDETTLCTAAVMWQEKRGLRG